VSRVLGVLVVGAVLGAGAACGSKGDEPPAAGGDVPSTLTIGVSLSLSGSLAREGILTREGYDLCQQVVNDKGGIPVGDRKVRLDLSYQDDLSKPDTAAQLIDQFNDRGVKLILGPYGSATTEAAAAVVERNGQVMADSSGADDKIFTKGYRRTFAVLSPARAYVASMVQALTELADPKPRTAAFLSADDGFSKTAAQGGIAKARELGIEVVADEYVPNGATDVSAALTKIKPGNPDVILVSAHLAEGVAAVKQAAELGVRPPLGFAETVAPPTPDFVSTLGPAAETVLGSTQWTVRSPGHDRWFGSAADYNDSFKARFAGREAEYHGAEGTAACLAFVLAVEKAGTTDANAVREAMAALDESSFFGPLKFTAEGQNLTKPMGVIQIQGGHPVSVWPRDAAEAPLRRPAS
jgi:branched-chain amino acid transport system substrate-binding protein